MESSASELRCLTQGESIVYKFNIAVDYCSLFSALYLSFFLLSAVCASASILTMTLWTYSEETQRSLRFLTWI